jgi:RimJ/RimL family protein N-acetyltransferase
MTPDVSLRPLQLDDAALIQRYASDARLAATCNVPHPYPAGGGKTFVRARLADQETGTCYPLAVLAGGALVGVMGLTAIDHGRGSAELDYWIAVPYWGRRLATAAVRLVVALAFVGLHLRTLESACLEENPASGRVLEKAGFTDVERGIHRGGPGSRFTGKALRRFRLRREDWIAQGATHPDSS